MMLNRLTSPWSSKASTAGWPDLDRDPQVRLHLLWLSMFLPILVIAGRVIQLQLYLKDNFAGAFSLTTETYEEIPARDGRIFASDRSTILADDIRRYDIAVYYPAIETPLDDKWVTDKAKPRLSKLERRDKSKVAAEKEKVIAENEYLWTRLAALTNRPVNELMESRQREQNRVHRIIDSVLRRFRERRAEAETKAELEIQQTGSTWEAFEKRIQRAFADQHHRDRSLLPITEQQEYCTVITDITEDMKLEIETNPEKYPYTRVLVQSRRTYPQGELAAHLIGARKPLTEDDYRQRKQEFQHGDPQDYRVGDSCGLFGLERRYDVLLKGVRGMRALVKNRRGEIIETRTVREPRHGRDLVLTLDIEVQRQAERLLDRALTHVTPRGETDAETTSGVHLQPTCPQGASAVVMEVHTGALVAAVAKPGYDLNLYVSPDAALWEDVISDKRAPLFSRVTEMALPPGSVFKAITAVASIESGKMLPDATFFCRGYLDASDPNHRCMPFRHHGVGHNDVTLEDALCRSCNVYFFTAARRMGPHCLVDWARKFGIGQPTGIDLPSESAGHLPAPDLAEPAGQRKSSWKPGSTLDMAIGQASLTVTPLQMVRAMAAIANDGELVVPHLAANAGPMSSFDGDSFRTALPTVESRPLTGLHPGTLEHVREGLTMVVNDPRGTAYKTTRLKNVTIAGKTGTAQTNGVDHAWFAGYVPAERPRFAFVVVLEHGGGGGKAAGPVAHDLVEAIIARGLIEKTPQVASDRVKRSTSVD